MPAPRSPAAAGAADTAALLAAAPYSGAADPYATLRSSRLARPKHRWSTWTADTTLLSVDDEDGGACHVGGKEPHLAQLWDSEAATQCTPASPHRLDSARSRDPSSGETEIDGPFDSSSSTSASRSSAALSDTDGSSAAPAASRRAGSTSIAGVSPDASPRGSPACAFPDHLLDAALESTSLALEQATALLQSTISARAGFARMRAAEAALDESLDVREVRLRQQIMASDEARGWVARACADLAALGVEPRRAVAPRASSWRMPSTGSAVAPVASTGQSAGAGWLDHKDEDATVGKSAAKRLQRVLSTATAPATRPADAEDDVAATAGPSHARQASGARDALALLAGASTAARSAGGAAMDRTSSASSSSASASPVTSAACSPARVSSTRKPRSSLRLPMTGLGIGASVSGPTVQTSSDHSPAVEVGPLSAASTSSQMSFASAQSHAGLQDASGFPFASHAPAAENEAGPSSATRPRPASRASIASLQSLASIDEAQAGHFSAADFPRACSDGTSTGGRNASHPSSSSRFAGDRGGHRSVSASSSTTIYAPPPRALSAIADKAGLPSGDHADQSTASLLLTPPSQTLDVFASPTPSLDGSHSGRTQLSSVRSPSLARPRRPGHSASSSFSDAHGSGRFRSSSADGTSSSDEEGAVRRRRKREISHRDRGALAALRRLNSVTGEESDTSTTSAAAAAAQLPVAAAAANSWGGTLASWLGASARAGAGDEDVV